MTTKGWIAWGAASLVAAGLVAQPFRPVVVRGRSMAPTYGEGQWLLSKPVDRPLRRGDVVVVDTPSGPIIKRVALLPGDMRVQWEGAREWIDMTTLGMPRSAAGHRRVRTLTVPAETVFLLGDNLGVSVDSRSFGPVPTEAVRLLLIDPRDPDDRSDVARFFPRRWLALAQRQNVRQG